jgi:glycosyltransferase involved in cell wall biosynthesis
VEGTFRSATALSRRVALDAAAGVRQLEAVGAVDPIVLACHPMSASNPYQQLLYARAWEHGIAPIPMRRIEDLADLPSPASLRARVAVHLHWTNRILAGATSDDDATARIDALLGIMDPFLAGGGQLVWTVHNTLPHGDRLASAEGRLQQAIVDRATVVHILAERTPDLVRDWFTIPSDRVLHVPHPSYRGAYPDLVGRSEARYRMGIDADEVVYAMVGAIRAYKGIDLVLDAFDAVVASDVAASTGRARRLVVAGPPGDEPEVAAFLERARHHPGVWLAAQRVPDDRISTLLRASDLALFPYRRSLNSGALMLALTFGLPVIAAETGALAELVTPSVGRLFTPADGMALVEAIRGADALLVPEARAAAGAQADAHDPVALSDRFNGALGARLRGPVLPYGRP